MTPNFLNWDGGDAEDAFAYVLPIAGLRDEQAEPRLVEGLDAVLRASALLEPFDSSLRCELWRFGLRTLPRLDAAASELELEAALNACDRECELFRPGRFTVAVLGDRRASYSLAKLARERVRELSYVRFSARPRLEEASRRGFGETVCVGARRFARSDCELLEERNDLIVTVERLEDDFERVLETVLWKTEKNVYLAIDMDAFDPCVAPGVETPEPGGLTWRLGVKAIDALVAGKCVVGADATGVTPLVGGGVVTEYAAASLIARLIGGVAAKRRCAL